MTFKDFINSVQFCPLLFTCWHSGHKAITQTVQERKKYTRIQATNENTQKKDDKNHT